MATIKFIKARQIFDSRGNPTVEVSFSSICSRLYFLCLFGGKKKCEKRKENFKIKSMFVLLERGLKSLNMHLIFRLMLVLKFLNIKVHRFLLELLCQAVLLQVKACVCVCCFLFLIFLILLNRFLFCFIMIAIVMYFFFF